jgi:four helix bundle protein
MPFEDLDVWKRATQLSVEIYRYFSDSRDFGFKDQITRSGLSVASNIAEGYERRSGREDAHFLNYAKGSAGELRAQIYIGEAIGYVDPDTATGWINESRRISRMLHGLIESRKSPTSPKP